MTNRLADAISPYLRSHADNPVDWFGWGADAFAEARARDVPVLVSIGYSTCHWCHVMARESFSDPGLAASLNERFVSIKVDREENPDVDASYLAAASAFTRNLGWPLNVFVTPDGQAFFAGTYFPPRPAPGQPSFGQVLDAVTDAWITRRDAVIAGAQRVADAVAAVTIPAAVALAGDDAAGSEPSARLSADAARAIVAGLADQEDQLFGGFGGAPKFPMAPVLGFLLEQPTGQSLALRTLKIMGASPLRDPVEGGFFRYAVHRDWSEPHYERMLYDNAQLLDLTVRARQLTDEPWARILADGVSQFLQSVMQLPSGGFASAQDSESTVDGERVEGGYYALDLIARRKQTPPALDAKVLTGWNGLAIGALARAGFAAGDPQSIDAARRAADYILAAHVLTDRLVRASVDGRISAAPATLEDYGMCAHGLLELSLVTGEVDYATAARRLIDSTLAPTADTAGSDATEPDTPADDPAIVGTNTADTADTADTAGSAATFRVPTGGDPVLVAQGLAVSLDPSEGAYPSGLTASADAARLLYQLTGESRYRQAADQALSVVAPLALAQPLAFGGTLRAMARSAAPTIQLVVVSPEAPSASDTAASDTAASDTAVPDTAAPATRSAVERDSLLNVARRYPAGLVASVTVSQAAAFAEAGFSLFADRGVVDGKPTAYFCRDFVCRLPITDAAALDAELRIPTLDDKPG
ncbi:thioredoxin domain-containing protein [Leifsonia sp. YAF41]|uniref:thioredoxin domain-containing protein n=1 Tax=Leifsonia sp. YAF41 TaxID=3233086 RepID=UPI003F9A71E6